MILAACPGDFKRNMRYHPLPVATSASASWFVGSQALAATPKSSGSKRRGIRPSDN